MDECSGNTLVLIWCQDLLEPGLVHFVQLISVVLFVCSFAIPFGNLHILRIEICVWLLFWTRIILAGLVSCRE